MSNLIESILRADDGNDTPRMLALCEQGLREQPNAAVMWALRARCHARRGATAARDADLARALALDPHCPDAIAVQVTARYDEGDPQAAWRLLRDASERASGHFGLLLAEAYLLINDRRLQDAIDCWTRAIQRRPQAGAPHCYIASNLANAGRHDEAVPYFERAVALAPGNGRFMYDAGNTYRRLGDLHKAIAVQVTARYDEGDPQAAWRLLRDASERASGHFGLLLAEAYLLINDRRLQDAIDCWTRAIQRRPQAGAPHCYIASNLANAGRHDEAVPYFERAVALAPGNGRFMYDAGNTYRRLGDLHKAIAMFDRARAILGEENAIQHNRASCLQALGRDADAVEEWTSLLRREPDWDWPLEGKARSLHRLGRASEAVPLWRKLDALSDNGWEGRKEQAREYVRSGHPELAQEALRDLDPLTSDDAQLLFVAGNAQRDQREWEQALAYYLRGYELAPDNDFLPGNAADMLGRLDRYEEALPLSEVAISLDPDWLKWRRVRIDALTHLGRGAEAVADAERALQRWPDNSMLQADAVNALAAAGRHDDALAACDRLIAMDPDFRSWALFSRGEIYGAMKRHAESASAFRQAAAAYQQNGKPQYQELSLNNALAAEQAASAPRGLLGRLFGRK